MKVSNITMSEIIAEEVKKAGGRAFYVGGYVRDLLMSEKNEDIASGNDANAGINTTESKDLDIEVHGIRVKTLEYILDSLGTRLTKGASFGVMGLQHYDIDIAMPRSESATGKGHKDFSISVDPFIGPEKASSRRDFTINAMMQDVLTGEILDFWGGREDLKKGLLRCVNPASFAEDPLRVFRAAQFAARFELSIDDDTAEISERMDVSSLSKERVMGELEKALLKSQRPSIFFEALRQMKQLSSWFPEIEALINCPQDPRHHPEGDVWTHTMQVLDEAAKFRAKALHPKAFMISALTHDIGKPSVTEERNGRIHAYAHESAGLPLTENMLHRLCNESRLIKYVLNMTTLHMQPNMKAAVNAKQKSFMKMFDKSVCPEDLLLLSKADYLGRHIPANSGSHDTLRTFGSTHSLRTFGSTRSLRTPGGTRSLRTPGSTRSFRTPGSTRSLRTFGSTHSLRTFGSTCTPDNTCKSGRIHTANTPFKGDWQNRFTEESYAKTESKLNEMLVIYNELIKLPSLAGKDLIAAGLSPGPEFSEALTYAHKLHLAGIPKDEQLRQVLGMLHRN